MNLSKLGRFHAKCFGSTSQKHSCLYLFTFSFFKEWAKRFKLFFSDVFFSQNFKYLFWTKVTECCRQNLTFLLSKLLTQWNEDSFKRRNFQSKFSQRKVKLKKQMELTVKMILFCIHRNFHLWQSKKSQHQWQDDFLSHNLGN